jgi:hypothetical protein
MRPLLLLAVAAVFTSALLIQRSRARLSWIHRIRHARQLVIVFTPDEMNAWARGRVPQMYQGIRDPNVQSAREPTGSAFVDFLKMRLATTSLIGEAIAASGCPKFPFSLNPVTDMRPRV